MSKICFTCGNELPDEAKFCNICGTLLNNENSASKELPIETNPPSQEVPQLRCPQCGTSVTLNANFCKKCGTSLRTSNTTVEKEKRETKPEEASDEDMFETYYSYYAGEDTDDSSTSGQVHNANSNKDEAKENLKNGQNAADSAKVNWKAIGSALSTIITIAIFVFLVTKHPVMDTKGIVFEDWGKIELGEAVERSLTNVEWSSNKIESKLYHVTVSGYSRDLACPLSLTFEVTYSGNHVYAEAISTRLDGEYFSDIFSIAAAMGTIYS